MNGFVQLKMYNFKCERRIRRRWYTICGVKNKIKYIIHYVRRRRELNVYILYIILFHSVNNIIVPNRQHQHVWEFILYIYFIL